MPIEIRELIIRTTVSDRERKSGESALSPEQVSDLRKELLAECLDKMKEMLNRSKSR